MIKHGLHFISTSEMSRTAWLAKRMDGVGGSDISSILGLNKNFSALALFYQKVGVGPSSDEENEAMFWGNRNENNVLEVGQYYDFETGTYQDNFNNGRKLRNISKLSYMVNNPDYPWILANLDGAINFDEASWTMDGPAEAKTISRQTAEMWINKIPPYHIMQIWTYGIVCEPMMRTKDTCIFYLEDGNKFSGHCIPISDETRGVIIRLSKDFWERVVEGRKIKSMVKDYDLLIQELSKIEPEYDNSENYNDWLSELFKLKSSWTKKEGDEKDVENAVAYKLLDKKIKNLENERQGYRNQIMQSLHRSGANVISLGPVGSIKWNKKLYVTVKKESLDV